MLSLPSIRPALRAPAWLAAGAWAAWAATAPAAPAPDQMGLARPLSHEAQAIVAVHGASVTPVDPREKPTRMQDYEVRGAVVECLKGTLRPPAAVSYRLTSEGRPDRLAGDHIAFLRRGPGRGWVAVDGPVFADSPQTRHGVRRLTGGCR